MQKATGQDFSLYDAGGASFKTCRALCISAKMWKARKVNKIRTKFSMYIKKCLQHQRGKGII